MFEPNTTSRPLANPLPESSSLLILVATLALSACGGDDGGTDAGLDAEIDASTDALEDVLPDVEVDAGPSCTVGVWDPDGDDLGAWPDESLLVEDDSTATGFRLFVDPTRYPNTLSASGGYLPLFTEDLAELDGFGSNAQAFFRYGRAFDLSMVPSGMATAEPSAGIGMVVLEDAPRIMGVLVEASDEDSTLFLAPMRPLPQQTWVAAYVTRALTDAAGGCLEPSPRMAERLAAPDARTSDAIDALVGLEVIEDPSEIISLSVFPVQTITDDTEAIAAHIATLTPEPVDAPVCEDGALWRRCVGSFTAFDYRDEDRVIRREPGAEVAPTRTHVLPYTVWLPLEGEGPFQTLVWGSGLGSGREQGARLADAAAPAGIATIAIDAVAHGEHPDVPDDADTGLPSTVFRFFAIGDELMERAMFPLALRDHFRQSTYDKLQLVRFVLAGLDVDGVDGIDLDPARLSYLGVSLGGIMGVELLASSEDLVSGVLVVPGGRVGSMVSDSDRIGPLVELLRPRGTPPGDIRRFFPVLQTLLDRGDAASFGPHVQRDRLAGGLSPHILAGVVLDDDTVPNVANYTLMRAMQLPLIGAELRAEPGIPAPIPAPVSGNVDGLTSGFLQFDVVRDGGGPTDATHGNVGDSETGIAAWLGFLGTLDDAAPTIIDPYVETGLDHE